ncbi:MAG: Crp/Fnr family transcriptional regulator [Archangium sp.]|nr:Crp/Fnr family transcriptional regulator [Archangium sp.]MDP3151671.1 Crp/Fnr family transcriptional regulator [Archangium sp.]MDP3573189.1 Crp/Fnr family transcriptional regulator [Archangium sp.]
MPKSGREYRELLLAGRWFQGLAPLFQHRLLEAGVMRHVPVEGRLFSRGDAPDGLYAALAGSIRIAGLSEAGKEAVLAVVEPPQWFGEIAVFDRLARTHDAIAAVESVVMHVPSVSLDAMLAEQPAWWRDLGLLVTAKLRLAFMMMEDMALLPLLPRVARRLVLMAEGYGEWSDRSARVVKVSQETLAAMVSSSRQSTNQALKELEARGLIKVAYSEIEIVELGGLRSVAGGGQ